MYVLTNVPCHRGNNTCLFNNNNNSSSVPRPAFSRYKPKYSRLFKWFTQGTKMFFCLKFNLYGFLSMSCRLLLVLLVLVLVLHAGCCCSTKSCYFVALNSILGFNLHHPIYSNPGVAWQNVQLHLGLAMPRDFRDLLYSDMLSNNNSRDTE